MKTEHRSNTLLDPSVTLLNDIIHIFVLSRLNFGAMIFVKLGDARGISSAFVNIDQCGNTIIITILSK